MYQKGQVHYLVGLDLIGLEKIVAIYVTGDGRWSVSGGPAWNGIIWAQAIVRGETA